MKSPKRLSRRQFIKTAGIAGSIMAVPALLGGYNLWEATAGEPFPNISPYTNLESNTGDKNSPILVLTNDQSENPFGSFLTEILRTEGLNCFQVSRVDGLTPNLLEKVDIILLAEGPLNNSQREILTGFVSRGGRLVAMRPEAQLAPLFGVEHTSGQTSEGYLQVEAGQPIGRGIAETMLQFHGTANHYHLAGAQPVAWLATDANTVTNYPALTIHQYEQGQTALWAFDLSRSIAYTRQGNPAWANQERDNGNGIRPVDMFKDWVDLDRIAIPQADEQQRLLANLLTTLSQEMRPLPRLWYFPGQAKGMLIATGDSHTNPVSSIEDVFRHVEKFDGHFSVYYTPWIVGHPERTARRVRYWTSDHVPIIGDYLSQRYNSPTPSLIDSWRARGHEFSMHPYVEEGLELSWQRYWEEFTGRGYGPLPPTVRTHRILWTGWVETARLQASYGIRLNLDNYHWGPMFQKDDGSWTSGYVTGSGLPMKFVDEQGRILNIYQQLTELADDHLLYMDFWDSSFPKFSVEEALEVSQIYLRESFERAPSATVAQFHVDPFGQGPKDVARAHRFLEGILETATALGFPIWSAKEWLHFTEIRHDTNFTEVVWQSETQQVSFRLEAQSDPNTALSLLIPLQHQNRTLTQIEVDGQPLNYSQHTVGGINYGWVTVPAAAHQIVANYI